MIDKVVRMRCLQGRFGIDYSEPLNYEIMNANKPREDHLNWLVNHHPDSKKVNLSEFLEENQINTKNSKLRPSTVAPPR